MSNKEKTFFMIRISTVTLMMRSIKSCPFLVILALSVDFQPCMADRIMISVAYVYGRMKVLTVTMACMRLVAQMD